MEQKKKSLAPNALVFGLITGFTLIILTAVLFMTTSYGNPLQYLGYLILVAGILIGTLNYRDKISDGYLSYGQSVGSGVLISVFAGTLLGLFLFVYIKYFNADFIETIMAKMQLEWEKKGMTEDQIQMAEKMTRRFMTPASMVIFSIIGYAFWGTIISLITSIFTKKDRPPFDNIVDRPAQ